MHLAGGLLYSGKRHYENAIDIPPLLANKGKGRCSRKVFQGNVTF
jgi:hypothetical protein